MKSSNNYDVIIVGAGPAGSACATMLARAGLRVLVCDRAKFPREKICGDCINPKNWQLFELLGVADEIRSRSLPIIESIKITNSKGQTVESHPSFQLNSPFFAMKRSELDALLLWNAEKAGAFVCEETQVTDVRWENRWEVFAKQNGRDAAFNADVFVGADGRNSIVAQKLSHEYSYVIKQPPKQKLTHLPKGYLRYLPSPDPATKRRDIPLPGIPLQRDSKSGTKNMKGRDYFFSRFIGRRLRGGHKTTERVGIQWHTHHQPSIRSTVEMFFFDSGYGGVVNVSPEHANVALVTSPSVAQLVRQDFSQFLERTLLNNPRAHKTFSNLDPTGEIYTTYPINPVAHSVHHPSAFLIGDARQTVEPFTGEGVYFALQDGIQTATKILQLLKKDAPSLAIKSRSRFLVNQVYSPLFRRYVVTGHLITAASRMPRLVSFVLRTVFS